MKSFITLLSFSMSLLLIPEESKAVIITQDYTIDVKSGNINTNGYFDSYFSDQPTLKLTTGDTLSGTIKFSDRNLLSGDKAYISALFYFSDNYYNNAAYRYWSYTYLIDENGNDVNYNRTYDNDVDTFIYLNSGSTANIKPSTKVAGMRFKIQFESLYYWTRPGPVDVRLSRISASPFSNTVSPIPEPSTWAMMMLGLTGVGLAMRRRRTKDFIAYA